MYTPLRLSSFFPFTHYISLRNAWFFKDLKPKMHQVAVVNYNLTLDVSAWCMPIGSSAWHSELCLIGDPCKVVPLFVAKYV